MNMMKMMQMAQKAQKLQADATKMQQELAARIYEKEGAGGQIRVKVNGEGRLVDLQIDAALIGQGDPQMLADLILATVQAAQDEAKETMAREMGKLTEGLGLGNLGGLLG